MVKGRHHGGIERGAGLFALMLEAPALFRLCAAAMLVATVAIVVELVLARRLANVSAAVRLPEGTRLPSFFVVAAGKR